ncbi:MAG: ATP-binding protein [Bacteroidales bacterium]|nr:ATP-binding protein [Bacteroidales bacterium]
MILDFTISNFRSIKEAQTISFEATKDTHLEDYFIIKKDKYRILKIATILGANASGKSNIIRAFGLLHDLILSPCENKNSEIDYDKFALDTDFVDNDSVMIVNFICGEQKYYYEVHFNNKAVTYELLKKHPFGELKDHNVYTRETDLKKGVSVIKWGSKYKLASKTRGLIDNLIHNRTVFGAFQNTNVDIPWMKEIIDWVDCYILPQVLPTPQGLFRDITEQIAEQRIDKEIIVRHLNKADIGISDFIIEKIDNDMFNNYEIRFIHNGSQGGVSFDVREESEGTKRYYELSGVLMLLVKENHFVTIDELECRLHPDLYEHFVLTYLKNTKESQIIFTTHSREFLNDRGLFRDDSVWITEKTDVGATNLYSLADFDSNFLRNTTNRYNMYKAGRLGGVPRLQDTYFGSND